jgi:O-antigen ligase/tetratricopeptide (TPR) repeat protein
LYLKLLQCIPFFIIPFLGGNHLALFYFTIDKFWIETFFVLSLLIAVSLSFYKRKEVSTGFFKFILYFMPFLIMNVVSVFYTWNRFDTLLELNIIVWIVSCVYLYKISENKDALLKALIFGTTLSVVCMIIQYKVLLPKLMEFFKDGMYAPVIKGKVVPFSSFLNEATLGGYFLFLIPLSIYFGVIQKKILYMFTSSIIIFGLLFSLSRMGMFIGALSIIACFVLLIMKKWLKKAVSLILIVLFALTMLFSIVYIDGKEKNVDFQDRAINRIKKTPTHIKTLTYRTMTWKIGFNAFLEKPLSGYGAGTFEHAYKKHYNATLYTKYAHNVFIKIMVELGLLGLISFLIYLFGFANGTIKLIRDTDDKDTKYLFIAISAISGFLFAVSNVTFEMPAYAITFFVLSSGFLARNRDIESADRAGQSRNVLDVMILLFIAIALTGSFFFTEKANISLKMNEEAEIFTENGLLQQAFVSYGDSINAMPSNDYGYIGIINVLLRSYKIEQSEYEKKKIKDIIIQFLPKIEQNKDKHSELYFIAGTVNSMLGDIKKAEAYFNKALQYHPSSGFYMYETAVFYFLNGNIEKAKALIRLMRTYADRHTGSEMHGLYVYKMRDLESNIEYLSGNVQNAVELARRNFEDAEKDMDETGNILAREYIVKEYFIKYLKDRVDFFESKLLNQ